MNRLIRTAAAALALVVPLAATGCGGTADVSGKVTYKGKPVVYGTVVVVGSDGIPKSGAIQPDGSYRVSGVPLGTAKVAVTSPKPPGSEPAAKKPRGRDADDDKPPPEQPPPAPPEVIQNWVSLPEKFGDPNKSEVTVTVKSGQPADIELK
jgi:hypothetical protein